MIKKRPPVAVDWEKLRWRVRDLYLQSNKSDFRDFCDKKKSVFSYDILRHIKMSNLIKNEDTYKYIRKWLPDLFE